MKKDFNAITSAAGNETPSMRGYLIGFFLSVVLTLLAFYLVYVEAASLRVLATLLVGLAVLQFMVQITFFLHLGFTKKGGWNLLALAFAVVVIGILLIGTLWIMANLEYHGHLPEYEEVQSSVMFLCA